MAWRAAFLRGVRGVGETWSRWSPSDRRWFTLKLVLFVVFIVATNQGIGRRSLSGYAFYAFAWLVSLASLVHIAFFGRRWNRVVWTPLLIASAITGAGFRVIYDAPLTLTDLDKLLPLLPFADMLLQFYGKALLLPALLSLLAIGAIHLPPFCVHPTEPMSVHRRLRGLSIQLAPIALMVGVLVLKHGDGTNGLAVQQTSLAFLPTLAAERIARGPAPERAPVTLRHGGKRLVDNLVVLMDESVRGDQLDLNREGGAISGLNGRPDVVNFGIMSSFANCSLESNMSFRFGIGRKDYLRQLDVNPSVWAYARKAGYAVSYFDAQRSGGALQNGMDERERAELDAHFQVPPAVKVQDHDIELAKSLRRALDEKPGVPKFFYVNKIGVHYPYEGKYPAEQARWSPVMRGDFFGQEPATNVSGCGCHCGQSCGNVLAKVDAKSIDADLRVRFKNSYLNALSWNTGHFFDILLDGLDLSNTLIVYMADHGQDFHEDGRPGLNTHCTPGDASPDEGRVPLAIITGNPEIAAELREAATINKDKLSQFSVFPSVLRWMGYPREAIATLSLDPPIEAPSSPDNQRFLSVFYVRLGGKPVWVKANERRPEVSGL